MRVVVHMQENGDLTFAADEAVEIIMVCDFVPTDRCYRLTAGGPAYEVGKDAVDAILRGDEIGHAEDDRHEAVRNRIESRLAGVPHLRPVE